MMSFLRDLIARRVPHIFGVYAAGSWALTEFMGFLEERGRISPNLVDLILMLLLLLMPSVAILAYFHGSPGRDSSPRVEKLAIGSNLAVAVAVLLLVFWGKDFSTSASASVGEALPPVAEAGRVPIDPNLVAVMPFDVVSTDTTLTRLRVGERLGPPMKILFPGGPGRPRAADHGTLTRLWQDLRDSEAEPTFERLLELARRLGAGRMLVGSIFGSPEELTLAATLHEVPGGQAIVTGRVQGSLDEFNALVGQLATRVFVGEQQGSIATQRLSQIPSAAWEPYLAGVFAAQLEEWEEATAHFDAALAADSSFHEAALQRVLAIRFLDFPASPRQRDARDFAWSVRDRMSVSDRAVLTAVLGADYGEGGVTNADLIASAAAAADSAPDRPETWQYLGRWLWTDGRLIGMPDWPQRATRAFDQVFRLQDLPQNRYAQMALFSELHIPGSPRLQERAEFLLEVERRWAERAGHDPGDDPYFGWLPAMALGDTAALARMRARRGELETFEGDLGWGAVGTSARVGWPLTDAKIRLAARARRAVTAADQRSAELRRRTIAEVEGRPSEVIPIFRAFIENEVTDPWNPMLVAMKQAVLEPGYEELGTWVAELYATRADTLEPSPQLYNSAYRRTCTAGIWRLSRGDTIGIRADLERIEAVREPHENLCPALFRAILEAESAGSSYPDLPAPALERTDSLLRRGENTALIGVGNALVAQLYERRRDYGKALAAARRWGHDSFWIAQIPLHLRLEGKYAKELGDFTAARRAYAHYLTLRTAPEGALALQRDSVLQELAELPVEDVPPSPPPH